VDRADQNFVTLFLRHQRRIFGFILTVLPDPDAADEVFQETSLILWSKAERFDPTGDFVRWAVGIAVNVIRNRRAKRRGDRLLFDDDLIDRIAEARCERGDEFDDRRRALNGCLGKLEPDDRAFVTRCSSARGEIGRIADETGRTGNSLHQRLHRLRRALLECVRRTMAREGTT